jgi:uncharacterized lipoprotein
MSHFKNLLIITICALFISSCSTINKATEKNSYQNSAQSVPPLTIPKDMKYDQNGALYPIPQEDNQQLGDAASAKAASLLPPGAIRN